MNPKILYIFTEGDDDERFFLKIIVPMLKQKYSSIQVLKYAQWKKAKVVKFLASIQTLGFDYIMAADIDFAEGVNDKIRILQHKFENLEKENAVIVIAEIESWYIAGITDEKAEEFQLETFKDTEIVTKEKFNTLYHRKFHSRIDFMNELLKFYSIDTAIQRNKSFKYFMKKYIDGFDNN